MTRREHLLVRAMEECAELTQRISKALVFGLDEVQPDPHANPDSLDNRERLIEEYNDLVAVLELAGFPLQVINGRKLDAKRIKVDKYLRWSQERGLLVEGERKPVQADITKHPQHPDYRPPAIGVVPTWFCRFCGYGEYITGGDVERAKARKVDHEAQCNCNPEAPTDFRLPLLEHHQNCEVTVANCTCDKERAREAREAARFDIHDLKAEMSD
jgi:hypothetical protein